MKGRIDDFLLNITAFMETVVSRDMVVVELKLQGNLLNWYKLRQNNIRISKKSTHYVYCFFNPSESFFFLSHFAFVINLYS